MSANNEVWALIPARSGSKGFTNKNISPLLGIPLLAHSINFAKKLRFVDRIIVSTDCRHYADIAVTYGAEAPFLRGDKAASDMAMEEDILWDIKHNCDLVNIEYPKSMVWLRPTHPLRLVKSFDEAFRLHKRTDKAVCLVIEDDARLFIEENGSLRTVLPNFDNRSMVRRQDCPKAYRIFAGEIFEFPSEFNQKFLGDDWIHVVMPKECKFDIDDQMDLERLETMIKLKENKYKKYIHTG